MDLTSSIAHAGILGVNATNESMKRMFDAIGRAHASYASARASGDAEAIARIRAECTRALDAAAFGRHHAAVHQLLECGADPFAKLPLGGTPLHTVVVSRTYYPKDPIGHCDRTILAILRHPTVSGRTAILANTPDIIGCTALHSAASNGHDHLVGTLLECGASRSCRTNHGETALQLAEKAGRASCVHILRARS